MGDGSLHLSASANGRYFQNAHGTPFHLRGMSLWLLALQRRLGVSSGNWVADQNLVLDTIKARGINAILMMILSRYQDSEPQNGFGVAPFTDENDCDTRNAAFFEHHADTVKRANERGIVPFISPLWDGFSSSPGNDYNWSQQRATWGTTKCFNYGAYIASLLEPLEVVYMAGGDNPSVASLETWQAIIDGIRSVDTRHLITAHWYQNHSDSQALSPIHIRGVYEWGASDLYQMVRGRWEASPARPISFLEGFYELNDDFGWTPKIARVQEAMAWLMGSRGSFFGHEGCWHLGSVNNSRLGDQSEGHAFDLNSAGLRDFLAIQSVFSPRRWWELVPDFQGASLITAGRGTYGATNYVGLSSTPDGKLAIAYVPDGGQVTWNMGYFTGPVVGRLVDPSTGTSYPIDGAQPFIPSGTRDVNPVGERGNNAAGDGDWFIVMETVPSATTRRASPVIAGGAVSSSRIC